MLVPLITDAYVSPWEHHGDHTDRMSGGDNTTTALQCCVFIEESL